MFTFLSRLTTVELNGKSNLDSDRHVGALSTPHLTIFRILHYVHKKASTWKPSSLDQEKRKEQNMVVVRGRTSCS